MESTSYRAVAIREFANLRSRLTPLSGGLNYNRGCSGPPTLLVGNTITEGEPGMYVRFVISEVDDSSGKRQGLFQRAYAMRRSNELPWELHEHLDDALNWLDSHLNVPTRFTRGKRTGVEGLAISWFKDSAHEYIGQMRSVCRVLNEQGIPTEMHTTDRPGYIVWQDTYQVVAVPFSDTKT